MEFLRYNKKNAYELRSQCLVFYDGDPEGSRTPDLQDENLTSWTTRRRGRGTGKRFVLA